jgi:Transglycosylase SLT domain
MSEPSLSSEAAAPGPPPKPPVKGIEKVSASFVAAVKAMGARLNLDPLHLLAIMSFESGFNPAAQHSASKATGLIQFLPSTAKDLGTSTAALLTMTAEQQLPYVEKYFSWYRKQFETHNTLEDAYMAVLYPAAIGKGGAHVLFRKPSKTYAQNKVLDLNGDGTVTVADAAARVRARILA